MTFGRDISREVATTKTIICKACGNPFEYKVTYWRTTPKLYCNRSCKDKHWNRNNKDKVVKKNEKYWATTEYCSPQYKEKLARKRRRRKLAKLFADPRWPIPTRSE